MNLKSTSIVIAVGALLGLGPAAAQQPAPAAAPAAPAEPAPVQPAPAAPAPAAPAPAAPGPAAPGPAAPDQPAPGAPPAEAAPAEPAEADEAPPLVGEAAFTADWREAAPGQRWLIRAIDLPPPFATESATNSPRVQPRPEGALPEVPDGYAAELFAEGLDGPRTIRVAPNGDVFIVESDGGAVRVFRPGEGGLPADQGTIFADGLDRPYGLAFYPADEPEWVYVSETSRVIRFPYQAGDAEARGEPEVIVADLPTGGHWTRDIAFSPDGEQLFIAVGSESNVGQEMGPAPADIDAFQAERTIGAAWGNEETRAAVLVANPDGSDLRIYATGLRNCSGLTIERTTGSPWCAVNERDGLGDNVPPDYVTRVQEGGFYGWPWYYIGRNEDPRHEGPRPDLAQYVVAPDVLILAHSAPLGLAFYEGEMFPTESQGDIFVALHGSWNRGQPTGYKIIRVIMEGGQPTRIYEDFMTGFITEAGEVWGRPVGVAVAADGALLVSEDGNGTIWRVSYTPPE